MRAEREGIQEKCAPPRLAGSQIETVEHTYDFRKVDDDRSSLGEMGVVSEMVDESNRPKSLFN